MKKKIETGIWMLGDGRYWVRTTATCDRTGHIKTKESTLPTGSTIKDAREEVWRLKNAIRRGSRQQKRETVSVLQYATQWLAKRDLRPSVQDTYARGIEQIGVFLGDILISEVAREDVQAWVQWAERQQQEDGTTYATATVQSWWRVLKVICRDAVADRLLDRDPTERVRPPDTGIRNIREKRTLSPDELGNLVVAAKQFVPHRAAEIITVAYTGMRTGELYGLRWSDVDLSRGMISVVQAVSRGELQSSTKTGAARECPIPTIVVDALRDHNARMLREQHPGLETGLVFPSNVATPRRTASMTKHWRLLEEAMDTDIRLGWRVLRRTFNTLMLSAGVDRIVLRSIVGHSSEEMTERYAGVRPDIKHEALSRIVRLTTPTEGS